MKKVNAVRWKRFKESPEGQEAIALFTHAIGTDSTHEELMNLAKKYNAEYFRNFGSKEEARIVSDIEYFDGLIADYIESNPPLETADDLDDLYIHLCLNFIISNFRDELQKDWGGEIPESLKLQDIPQKYYKVFLSYNMPLTLALYSYGLGSFLPNIFVMQYVLLKRFADKYDIELPEVPKRADYLERSLYYLDLQAVLIDFFVNSNIDDLAEICAYIFAYEFPEIKAELESEHRPIPEHPERIWLLVGKFRGDEKNMKRGFWQGNALTHRGDLCLFMENSPVSAMRSAWIAQEDGVIDPFFLYYSNTYIGQKIEFPAISFQEFKNNDYFKNQRVDQDGKPLKGNYVSKNFQDCSGWEITSADFEEIKRMLRSKGYDTNLLPSLPKYEPLVGVNIKVESDVTEQLLMPLLDRMGYEFNKDYFREVEFTAGHGETGYGLDKRPDVCLHMTGSGKNKGAQVVIEMKLNMSSKTALEEAFSQGLSYAKYGEARIYCLADQAGIYVFLRDKNKKFSLNKGLYFKWEEMSDNDKYITLKRLFEKE